ncbi:MAG TPA: hypothetical protein PLO37_21145 [Candidatus Hydrogenedentes bacterium]|nr:hypothetical protein [Candidatus Hydrogenedentota bacterium]HPG69361.1 hypothetical protein [Candidatus Hydrogenedentota bacterium]
MSETTARQRIITGLVLGYAAFVLILDTLAAQGFAFGVDWTFLRWRLAYGFDLFKFLTWFVVPFACCLPWMDWGALGVNRWKRADVILLAVLAGLGLAAVLIIPFVPSLDRIYHGLGDRSPEFKWRYGTGTLVWTFSWLIGWEFLHRYFLLTRLERTWARWGWLLVPVYEGVYHLQKPLIEAAGMVAFSLLVTAWARKRKNALLPFLAHLIVELELLAFMLVA